MDPVNFMQNMEPVPLVYPNSEGVNQYTNVLLIDSQVTDYQQFVDSANATTFPVVYSSRSLKTELLELLQLKFTSIARVGLVFASTLAVPTMFLDHKKLFVDNEVEPYSENVQFLINVITTFGVQNMDFLACNTLSYDNWTRFYSILTQQTGVVVGASNDKTGNIKYGGDWLMESTSEDIETVYFMQSIEYYQYLLDNPNWRYNVVNVTFDASYGYCPYGSFVDKVNFDGTTNTTSWATATQGLATSYCSIVNGNYLYVSTDYHTNKITKISLTNPTTDFSPNWVPTSQGLSGTYAMATSGNYLYIVNMSGFISKISFTNPSTDFTLRWATSAQGLTQASGIAIKSGYAYVSTDGSNTISKISLANPASDFTANWATSAQGLNYARGIAIYGNYLYVTNYVANTISQISLTNPTTDFNASWATSAKGLYYPTFLTIRNDNLYVANYGSGSINEIALPPIPPTRPCFKEGSKILTSKGYVPIENLRKGDLVRTFTNGLKMINMIGKRVDTYELSSERGKSQFYKCTKKCYPELFEDLIITGCHAILVDNFVSEEQREKVKEALGDTYITDKKFRLPACADDRASLYETPGKHTIYHLALDNDNYYSNYGIYANGLLVESCSKRYLKELSNMELIE